jgi:hypothetical protein
LSLPDPLVRGTDLDPSITIIKQNWQEKPLFLLFCDFLSLNNDVNVLSKSIKRKKNLQIFDFVGVLKVTDDKIMRPVLRIRDPVPF